MLRLNRRALALALIAFAGIAPVAYGQHAREGHEPRPSAAERRSAGERSAARREVQARQSYRAHPSPHPVRTQSAYATARRPVSPAPERPAVASHRQLPTRSIGEQRPADANVAHQSHFADGGRVHETSRAFAEGQVHVMRYGNTLSGTVERTVRPGFVSRTFVSGGRVQYTHVYQRQVWHQFGRSFAYETFVPAVRFPAVYYGWALAAWPRPVVFAWGWQAQPWYPVYGTLFTPYPVYTSPDLWMTDYIIAQSMQSAYQAQAAAPAPLPAPAAPVPDSGVGAPAAPPGDTGSTPQPGDAAPAPQSSGAPPSQVSQPPAMTPQVKAQLNAQIKVQLEEQQAATLTPAVLTTQSTPPALRPNHVFFQVVQPLDVGSGTPNGHCSLGSNDYIKRTGPMSDDDWKIPVVVELSKPSDCPEGLQTRVGLNDLNAMENEQEAQVLEAMQAASNRMGPNGPPSSAAVHPTLIAAGNATPDPGALDAIRHSQ